MRWHAEQREHDESVRSFGTLARMRYVPSIDCGRKRGLLEEINRTIEGIEHDVAARGAILKPTPAAQGAVNVLAPPAVED